MHSRRTPSRTERKEAGDWKWASVLAVAAVVVGFFDIWIGRAEFFYRDLATTQFPAFALAGQLGLSATNPYASFGQPYLGNPNLLVAYRSLLVWWSPSVNLLLHAVWGFAGLFLFLRRRGRTSNGAFLGALAYVSSGYVLSSMSFMNSTTTLAWTPWVLSAAITADIRRVRHIAVVAFVLAIYSISGEPVLILLTATLAIALSIRAGTLAAFALASLGGLFVTLPVHHATFAAARESTRVVYGYGWQQAFLHSLHPVRLVETLLPGLLGSPAKLVAGGWWGFAVSDNVTPYLHSVALGIVPVTFALVAALSRRSWRAQSWTVIAIGSLILAMGSRIPGAIALYNAVPPLQVFRYPIKLLFLATLTTAILAAEGFDLVVRQRPHIGRVCGVLATVCLLASSAALQWKDQLGGLLIRWWWDSRWRSRPEIVLAPILDAIPWRLLLVALTLAAIAVFSRRPRWAFAVLLLALIERAGDTLRLLPTVDAVAVRAESHFARSARQLGGTVFERAGKDLEPVRAGLWGRYSSNSTANLAIAQARQCWQLTGAPRGIAYAFNESADGSHTARDEAVQQALARNRDWTYRLKWLRAAGVRGVITPNLPYGHPGLTMVDRDTTIGIPETLFRIEATLPTYRRVGQVVWVNSWSTALQAFQQPTFNERTTIVAEGTPQPASATGIVTATSETPNEVTLTTTGIGPSMLLIARSYSRSTRAWVNKTPAPVLPANVHLMAVPVPAGTSTVRIRLRP